MHARQVADVLRVSRMRAVLYNCDTPWRIELERELLLEI
jgi:hypothetical protein